MINHIRRWNIWRKHSINSFTHKILVLFRMRYSPTLEFTLLPEEENKIINGLQKGLKGEKGND
jgi:hypothetical protein|nr:MAG TPA: hypothetical protein [Caudoviricetes sp.]